MNDFETKQFEVRLNEALRRVDSPEGFADRVMARVEAAPRRKLFVMSPRTSTWVTGAIAAVLALGIFTGQRVHLYHERQLATQQFETATRIEDQALAHARQQLERAGVPLD